jgi:hypothetical protein
MVHLLLAAAQVCAVWRPSWLNLVPLHRTQNPTTTTMMTTALVNACGGGDAHDGVCAGDASL